MSARDEIDGLRQRMGEAIIGQQSVIERLLIGLLANGNLLVEGLPGLAKTRAIKALARNLDCSFSRIQFTPDLLPSDVTGTEVYHQSTDGAAFRFDPGPIFANIVLADEINRAPAKVQAALLVVLGADGDGERVGPGLCRVPGGLLRVRVADRAVVPPEQPELPL